MKLNKKILSLLLCFVIANSANAHPFSSVPWQDLSCWWQESINPFSFVDFPNPVKVIAENATSFWSSTLFTKVGAVLASIGIATWFYKKKSSSSTQTRDHKLWFLKEDALDLSSEKSILKAFASSTGHKLDIDVIVATKLDDCAVAFERNRKILETNRKNLAYNSAVNQIEIAKLQYALENENKRIESIAKYLNKEVLITIGMKN